MKKWSANELEYVIYLLNSGKSCEEISKIIERTKKAIEIKLNKEGVSISMEKREELNCLNCKKEFISLKSEKRKFCSSSCSVSYNNKNRTLDYLKTKEANCIICGEHIEVNIRASSKKSICQKCKTKKKRKTKKKLKSCKVCNAKIVGGRNTLCNQCKMNFYKYYKVDCKFRFSLFDYKDEFNLELVKENGWYSPTNKNNNLFGVSRDHMLSMREAYENKINPIIIRHPANCKLMIHPKNNSKKTNSSITLFELLHKIEKFEIKYKRT